MGGMVRGAVQGMAAVSGRRGQWKEAEVKMSFGEGLVRMPSLADRLTRKILYFLLSISRIKRNLG